MPDLVIPTSEIRSAGRAARVREPVNKTGTVIAAFGQQLGGIAEAITASESKHELARARVDITRDLGALNQKYKNIADPAEIDTGWATDLEALRETYKGRISADNWGQVNLAIDDLSGKYGLNLGQRSIDLRNDRSRNTLAEYTEEIYRTASDADDETRVELEGNLADAYADAVANNLMSEEAAGVAVRGIGENIDRAVARRMLSEDPAALVEKLEDGGFPGMDPQVRITVLAGAKAAITKAQTAAVKEGERMAKERNTELGQLLDTVTHIAGAGRNTVGEDSLLADPAAKEHEKYQTAVEAVNLRNTMPEFFSFTLAEMDAALAEEKKRPLVRKDETKRLGAMQTARDTAAEAWKEDRYAQAEKVLGQPPPDLPEFSAAETNNFVRALGKRRNYAHSLNDAGYTPDVEFFSAAEKDQLKKIAGVETDPRERLALANSLIRALGPDAAAGIAEIGGDPMFEHAGGLIAAGGRADTAQLILQGQQAIANKTVVLPKPNARLNILFSQVSTLFNGNDAAEARLREAADAIYASNARGVDPTADSDSSPAFEAYAQAIHLAMGGDYDKNGDPVGGTQIVNDTLTVLPIGVTASDIEDAFEQQTTAIAGKKWSWLSLTSKTVESDGGTKAWLTSSRSGGLPRYAGEVIDFNQMGELKLQAVGNDLYQLYIEPRAGQRFDITDSENPGQAYQFSLKTFLAETGQ